MNEVVYVSEETYNWLLEELDKPPKPNENLKKLMQTPSPWEPKRNTENDIR